MPTHFAVAEGNSDATAAVYQGAGAAAGKELDYSSVEALEAAIIEYVQQEVLDDQKKKWVVIKGAKDVKYKHINEVAKAAAAVEEITNMAVAVTQEN